MIANISLDYRILFIPPVAPGLELQAEVENLRQGCFWDAMISSDGVSDCGNVDDSKSNTSLLSMGELYQPNRRNDVESGN